MVQPPPGPPPERPYEPWPAPMGERKGTRSKDAAVPLAVAAIVAVAAAATGIVLIFARDSGSGDGRRLRSPVELRQVTAETPGACSAGGAPSADGRFCYRLGRGMTVRRVADIDPQIGTGSAQWTVVIKLDEADRPAFADLTTAVSRQAPNTPARKIAIVVGGRVVSAPEVQSPIPGGDVQISGDYTRQTAEALVRQITGTD